MTRPFFMPGIAVPRRRLGHVWKADDAMSFGERAEYPQDQQFEEYWEHIFDHTPPAMGLAYSGAGGPAGIPTWLSETSASLGGLVRLTTQNGRPCWGLTPASSAGASLYMLRGPGGSSAGVGRHYPSLGRLRAEVYFRFGATIPSGGNDHRILFGFIDTFASNQNSAYFQLANAYGPGYGTVNYAATASTNGASNGAGRIALSVNTDYKLAVEYMDRHTVRFQIGYIGKPWYDAGQIRGTMPIVGMSPFVRLANISGTTPVEHFFYKWNCRMRMVTPD